MAAKAPVTPPPLTDLDSFTESINLLAYGDPGAGKTVLAGTGDEGCLILATEPGTISAKRQGSKAKTVRVQTYPEFAHVLNSLRRTGSYSGFSPEWLCIDTATELQNIVINGIMADPPDGKFRAPDTMQIQDYGTAQTRFKRIIHAINALPMNVLYTTHAMRVEDEEGEPITLPDLTGKWGTNDQTTAARWVAGTVHAYGYLKVVKKDDTDVRRWLFRRQGPYFGKDRYGVLAPYIDNPNLREIEARILASNTPKEG